MKTPYKTDPDNAAYVYVDENSYIPRVVVCAACLMDNGVILCGARHWDSIMREQAKAMGYKPGCADKDQGFIDQYGQFMNREEAAFVVEANNQPLRKARVKDYPTRLYSEDLY